MIHCARCGLVQTARPNCLRCEARLPDAQPLVVTVERVVEKVVETQAPALCATCGMMGGVLPTLADAERVLIRAAMKRTDGNRVKAAAMLGIGKTTLYRKLAEYEAQP